MIRVQHIVTAQTGHLRGHVYFGAATVVSAALQHPSTAMALASFVRIKGIEGIRPVCQLFRLKLPDAFPNRLKAHLLLGGEWCRFDLLWLYAHWRVWRFRVVSRQRLLHYLVHIHQLLLFGELLQTPLGLVVHQVL